MPSVAGETIHGVLKNKAWKWRKRAKNYAFRSGAALENGKAEEKSPPFGENIQMTQKSASAKKH